MTTSMTTIDVIICAYSSKRWDDLIDAIESVLGQRTETVRVIAVIDHNEQLLERLNAESRERGWGACVKVIANSGGQGLSGARNTGVSAAEADVVAFLDDDAVAEPGWIEAIAREFRDPDVRGIGGHAQAQWPEGLRPAWLPREFEWVVGCSYRGQTTVRAPIRNPIGCNMAFRRSDLVAVGGFAEGIGRIGAVPLGCEETELSIRVARRDSQAQIVFVPSMRVRHRVSPDRTQKRYFYSRCRAEGLSKAAVSRMVGSESALASETTYISRTLTSGIALRVGVLISGRGLDEWGAHSRADIAKQIFHIVGGLAATAQSYFRGLVQQKRDGPMLTN